MKVIHLQETQTGPAAYVLPPAAKQLRIFLSELAKDLALIPKNKDRASQF